MEVLEGNLKNVCQKAIKTNSSSCSSTSNVPMFCYDVIKMNEVKNRLTFVYYSLTFWDFKSLKACQKPGKC